MVPSDSLIDQRLDTLMTVLLWEGEIDNQRIRELLGVKVVWASRLMGMLTARLGSEAAREGSHAPLRLTPRAATKRSGESPDKYLALLGVRDGMGPDALVEDARKDLAHVAPGIFAAAVQAIRMRTGLQLVYRSMTHPEGTLRLVFPHALVRAPRRWHIRAWCSERESFRDFTLGRMEKATGTSDPAPRLRSDDREWNNMVRFSVVAHPALSTAQQSMIAAEFYPGARARVLTVRECLLGYTIQDLRLATNPKKQCPPDFQLHILNPTGLPKMFVNVP